ncbi:MAG: phosphoribosyltransferase [Candidatus Odinarchaeia archaeon]
MVDYVALTWDEIYDMHLELAEQILKSGFKPDIIVGIARGGWVIGRILSDLLANNKTANLKIEFYIDIGETAEKPKITQEISVDISHKKILVCDDVSDTGKSLKAAVEHLKEKGASEIKVACLHKKSWSIFLPDYYVANLDKWIIYPWEIRETVRKIIAKMKEKNKTDEEIMVELNNTGIRRDILKRILALDNL